MSLKLKYQFSYENKQFTLLPHIATNLIEKLARNPQKILPHLAENMENAKKNVFFEEIIFEDKEKKRFDDPISKYLRNLVNPPSYSRKHPPPSLDHRSISLPPLPPDHKISRFKDWNKKFLKPQIPAPSSFIITPSSSNPPGPPKKKKSLKEYKTIKDERGGRLKSRKRKNDEELEEGVIRVQECDGWEEEVMRRQEGRKREEDGRREEGEEKRLRRIEKGYEEEGRKREREGIEREREREEEGKGAKRKEEEERIWKGGRKLENLCPWETTFDDEFD